MFMVENTGSNISTNNDINEGAPNNVVGNISNNSSNNNPTNIVDTLKDVLRSPEIIQSLAEALKGTTVNTNEANKLGTRREFEEQQRREEDDKNKKDKIYQWCRLVQESANLPYSSEDKKHIVQNEIKKLDNKVDKHGMSIDRAKALAKLIVIKEELDTSEEIVKYHQDSHRIKELFFDSNVDTHDIKNEDLLDETYKLVTSLMKGKENNRALEQRKDLASYSGDYGVIGLKDISNKGKATITDYLYYLTNGSKGVNRNNPKVTLDDFKKFAVEQYKNYQKSGVAKVRITKY